MKRNIAETSLSAYRSLDPDNLRQIYKDIVMALRKIEKGTYEEVAAAMKIEPSRVWKRMNEIEKMGLICRPGDKKLLSSGRNGFVWHLTENVSKEVKPVEKSMKGNSVSFYTKNINKIIQQSLF